MLRSPRVGGNFLVVLDTCGDDGFSDVILCMFFGGRHEKVPRRFGVCFCGSGVEGIKFLVDLGLLGTRFASVGVARPSNRL